MKNEHRMHLLPGEGASPGFWYDRLTTVIQDYVAHALVYGDEQVLHAIMLACAHGQRDASHATTVMRRRES